jgi:hypothetical protein
MSLEELLLLEVESLEQVRVIDELVSHRLVEIQEHKRNVLADVLLDLADPLGVVLAVLDHPVVSLKSELDLLENLLGGVVVRLTIDCHEE